MEERHWRLFRYGPKAKIGWMDKLNMKICSMVPSFLSKLLPWKPEKSLDFILKGLSAEYDFKKIVKVAKKEFACNGTVVEHPEYGEVKWKNGPALHNKNFERIQNKLSHWIMDMHNRCLKKVVSNKLWKISGFLVELYSRATYSPTGCAAAGRPEGENLSNAGETISQISSWRRSTCAKSSNKQWGK